MAIACAYARTTTAFSLEGTGLVGKLESHVRAMLATLDTDPASVKPPVDIAVAMEKFEYDKKHRVDCYRVVTPSADGALALIAIPRDAATRAGLERSYRDTLASLGWPVA